MIIEVADNGIGIDPEHQGRIFEVFQRLHGQDDYQGTGIGLAIVHKSAQLMGGEVTVASAPREGSRFSVSLPACADDLYNASVDGATDNS